MIGFLCLANANLEAFPSATFIVEAGWLYLMYLRFLKLKIDYVAGANKLSRPVAGGKVAAGVLKTEALAAVDTTTASAD